MNEDTNHVSKNKKEIALHCQTCGRRTGVVLAVNDLPDKFPGLKPDKQDRYLHGLCEVCKKDLERGCVIFVDADGRAMKVTESGAKRAIAKEFHGKVVMIPKGAMDELVKVWMKGDNKPPTP